MAICGRTHKLEAVTRQEYLQAEPNDLVIVSDKDAGSWTIEHKDTL